jgi:sugar/nucleoside kinase (ribokinase family)
MFPDSGANADLSAQAAASLIDTGTHVHLSGYTLLNRATRDVALAALARAEAVGATRSLDPASAAPLRANLPFFLDLLPRFDLVLANEDEAAVLAGQEDPHDALETLADHVATVVVKVGARGVLARDPAGTLAVPALRHDVVDTTGAGDAFTAGFLPVWLAGAPLAQAIEEGQRLAGAAVGRVGASPLAH